MNLSYFHFRKPRHHQHYLSLKPFTFQNPYLYFTKFINTSIEFSQNPIPTTTLSKLTTQKIKFYSTPTIISCSKLLSKCTASKSLTPGLEIHAHVIKFGFSQDQKIRNYLVNLYSKCQLFGYARKLLDISTEPDLVSWSALISGYSQNGFCQEAILAYYEMHLLGIKCNEFAFPSVLKACTVTKDLVLGKQVHGIVVITGFDSDEFVANSLVILYAKCGGFGDARRLFDAITDRSVVSWNALFSCYVHSDMHGEAVSLFHGMVLSGTRPNEFSLSSMINVCTGLQDSVQGRNIHGGMNKSGMYPNMFTLSSALKACAGMALRGLGRQLHSSLIKMDIGSDSFLGVGLIDMYSKCNSMDDARLVFKLMPERDMIAWNAVISGHSQNEEDEEAVSLFLLMHAEGIGFNQTTLSTVLKSIAALQANYICKQIHALSLKSGFELDNYVVNSLIDTYGKCGHVEDATRVFKESPVVDLVLFTSLVTTCAQNGQGEEALRLYLEMQDRGIKPDSFVCSSLLNACASLSAYEQGKQVHVHILKFGFIYNSTNKQIRSLLHVLT
ncbi:hypothetical protein SADUNF_Sadunf04G0030800 [Salix dunnii]|uniref:Pentatricopeptide repeat-containing protein n=1 Tax=Salix dunnii TaxID=1413687 RepID=A0A835N2L9_9ROSI|nr:hypothetical protein SADUNF_Sadunf04G0030800 [Salix dunnii]